VVRVSGYRSRGPGSIPSATKKCSGSGTGSTQPRDYNLGATWKKNSGSGLEIRKYSRRDPSPVNWTSMLKFYSIWGLVGNLSEFPPYFKAICVARRLPTTSSLFLRSLILHPEEGSNIYCSETLACFQTKWHYDPEYVIWGHLVKSTSKSYTVRGRGGL
jgi:hypothetical protein